MTKYARAGTCSLVIGTARAAPPSARCKVSGAAKRVSRMTSSRGESSPLEYPSHVAGAVEDAEEFDAAAQGAVEDEVIADGKAPQARAQFGAALPGVRMVGQHPQRRVKRPEQLIGRVGIVRGDVVPDRGVVLPRRRRPADHAHQAPFRLVR